MRAWWSMLLVPKNDTNLRSKYACSLLCLLEPTQKVASGPLSFLIASSLSLTSFSASSQVVFFHLPSTSFIGYLRRCSPWPCSRIDAPLAQCAPRLIGESNTGSWRIHTPFCTTASIAQPTEQCVHTVRLTSILPPSALSAALALPIIENGNWLTAAPAPTARPERLRNARRSMVLPR